MYEFDEQSFIEQYHPNYNCQLIGDSDDIAKVINNDYDEDQEEDLRNAGYFDMTIDELKAEQARIDREILSEAFENYLNINYPIKDESKNVTLSELADDAVQAVGETIGLDAADSEAIYYGFKEILEKYLTINND